MLILWFKSKLPVSWIVMIIQCLLFPLTFCFQQGRGGVGFFGVVGMVVDFQHTWPVVILRGHICHFLNTKHHICKFHLHHHHLSSKRFHTKHLLPFSISITCIDKPYPHQWRLLLQLWYSLFPFHFLTDQTHPYFTVLLFN